MSIGDESGRTANNEGSLAHGEDSSTVANDSSKQISNSIDHRVDITSSSAINCLHRRNNVVLESEEVCCVNVMERSDRHRRHKHGSRHKHKHKRRSRHKTKPSLHPFGETGSSSTCISESSTPRTEGTYFQVEEPAGDVESKSVKQPESPTVERMRSEIDELNVLIRQHEQELLNL